MASATGIDLGAVYRTSEAVKNSRMERDLKERALQTTAAGNVLAGQAASGDKDAYAKLVALDPKRAQDMTAAFTAMSDAERKQQMQQVDAIGRLAAGVLSADDPAAAYKKMLTQLPPDAAAKLPSEYSEGFVKLKLAEATETSTLFENIMKGQQAETDHQNDIALEGVKHNNRLAEDVAKGEVNIKVEEAKARAKGLSAGLKAADASLIYRQAAGLMGGTFDAAGNVQALDPSVAGKVQDIAALADEKFKTLGDHAAAVKAAAEELGIMPANNNPLAGGGVGGAATTMPTTTNQSDPLGLLN
jgi:hypothetical protein